MRLWGRQQPWSIHDSLTMWWIESWRAWTHLWEMYASILTTTFIRCIYLYYIECSQRKCGQTFNAESCWSLSVQFRLSQQGKIQIPKPNWGSYRVMLAREILWKAAKFWWVICDHNLYEFFAQMVKYNFGTELCENPVEHVFFYYKSAPSVPVILKREKVSLKSAL